ncbi:MAG: hypothetical protein COA43_15035 [Robiginitomaculum sp.]|nr:MAG: hypothetical protein COA43_15035 [Robiginitomaculum sp.]
MTISTNDNIPQKGLFGGAFADALTLIRILLTPLIMFVIIKAWSAKPDDPMGFVSLDLQLVLLASILFVIAALTDIADDFIGGDERTSSRFLGKFDDVADSILIAGTLLALLYVSNTAGLLHWTFAVPAFALLARDIIVSLIKSHQLSKFGLIETRLGDIKGVLAMLGVCILVASPWLSNIVDSVRAGNTVESALNVYDNASPLVWNIGLCILWMAAILSLITGLKLLTSGKTETIDSHEAI